ncbi:MAG TPA: hypothetical protein VGC80_16835, partial [Acetobacteraceae bacterium]
MPSTAPCIPAPPTVAERLAPVLPWLAVLLLPPAVLLAFRFPPVSMNNYQDAFFYLGLAQRPADLIARFGPTYFSVRFGYLLPEAAFAALFKGLTGLVLLRYALTVMVGTLLYATLAPRGGRVAALFAFLFWLVCPITARLTLGTYVDLTVVTFAMAGILVLLRRADGPTTGDAVLGGALFGLAIHSNFFAFSILAALLPAYAILYFGRAAGFHLRILGGIVAGIALTTAAGFLFYRVAFGVPNLFAPTLDTIRQLLFGDLNIYASHDVSWMARDLNIYAPVPIFAAWIACHDGRRDRFTTALAVVLPVQYALCLVFDGFFSGYSLKYYWYFSYLLPGMTLCLGSAAVMLARQGRRGFTAWPCAVLGLAVTAWMLAAQREWVPHLAIGPQTLAIACTALLMLAAAVRARGLASRTLVAALSVCGGFWLMMTSPDLLQMYYKRLADDRPVVREAL